MRESVRNIHFFLACLNLHFPPVYFVNWLYDASCVTHDTPIVCQCLLFMNAQFSHI